MLTELPALYSERLRLQILDGRSAPAVLDYYLRNRDFHQPWFAARADLVFTENQQRVNLAAEYDDFKAGRAVPFWLFHQDDPDRVIGRFAFTSIIRGCFNSSYVAYHLDKDCQGCGFALEAGQAAIPILFKDFKLHRIEANIMPANQRSIALAERLGFRFEGQSPRYLKINDRWEDHFHFVRFADGPGPGAAEPVLTSRGLVIRPLTVADIPAAMEYYQRNLDYLYCWNPAPAGSLTAKSGWLRLFAQSQMEQAAGQRLDFGLFLADQPQRMVGSIECRRITPLPFSCCEIGFSIDQLLSGQGLLLEALAQAIAYLLARYALKRVTASVCADNSRSLKLLEILGFQQEGRARQALYLRGVWQDLINLALLKEDFRSAGTDG